ncbi:MAG: translation initiation factor IF-2 [Bacteroidota bacterium]|jgi:translation initiation factor IF-2
MSEAKQLRLSKVAKEFNLALGTITDFLAKKGHKVEANPNAKIDEEQYNILLAEFSSEKNAKQEAQQVSQHTKQKKESVELNQVKITALKKEEETEEILIKDLNISTTNKEETIKSEEKKIAEVGEEEVIKAKGDANLNLKVVSKIDLGSINQKTKPEKKSTGNKSESTEDNSKKSKKTKTQEPEIVPVKEPEVVTPAAVSEEVKEDFLETKYEKLEGPKIMGKISLTQFEEKKKPVASSSGSVDNKKKRKRIKKGLSEEEIKNVGQQQQKIHRDKVKERDKDRRRGNQKVELTEEEIQQQIKETLARLSSQGTKSKASKYRREKREEIRERMEMEMEEQEANKKTIKVAEFVSANQLAQMMDIPVNQVISTCMQLGLFVSINQRLDAETISIVASEFGYQVEFVTVEAQEAIKEEEDKPEDLTARPPIVTVMGHVDHGKTSLLDFIRNTNVTAGEAGGITQHIGAYNVKMQSGKSITFLDTPGHEAFTAMRARGAKVTDVAIIVVAADDSIMPQTKEAINHAQAAGVPMVFAINKIDKPGANPDKIREGLAQMNILVEEWGGKFQCQEVAAKFGKNVDLLLEKVLLEAELLELKANPAKLASGTIIESKLDKGRGYESTILVETGTLKIGDMVLAGSYFGRVKAMHNERGQNVESAGPAVPVLILGLSGAPQAGDKFHVMRDEREAKEIATKRLQLQREQGIRTQKHITLDEIGRRLAIGDFKELNIIVKGDVDGSIEALADSLLKLSTEKIQVKIIHKSVGAISESDVMLASASNAIIVGFQVRPTGQAKKIAETEQIDIRLYSIIYDAINEIKAAMEGMLAPEFEEKNTCNIEIREVFKITKVGTIAGCYVLDGKVNRNTKVRIIRNGIVVHTGELGSLKRFKDDVKEVASGYECGLNIANFNDIEVGDIIEGYELVEVKPKL